MKKTLALILALAMVVLLAACGTTAKAPASSSAPAASTTAAASSAAPAKAAFPTHQIAFLVGYEPGGSSDGICRLIATYMSNELKQPVIIENLPGASNLVALNTQIARGSDGYTVGMSASADSPWAYEVTTKGLNWKADDFTILARMTAAPSSMGTIVSAKKWKTFPDFIKDAKAAQAKKPLNYGILGPGRLDDPQIDEMQKLLNVKFNVVHYTSSSSIQTDILSGDLDAGTIGCNRQNFVANDSFRVLALYGASVPADFPVHGIPFLADYQKDLSFNWADAKFIPLENGGTNVIIVSKVDKAIQQVYKDALKKVSQNAEYKQKMTSMSFPSLMETDTALNFMHGIQDALRASQGAGANTSPAVDVGRTTAAASKPATAAATAPAATTAAASKPATTAAK